jgi:hypothetical protein
MNPLVVAGATAVVLSKRGRSAIRKGVVYGLASVLTAGETVVSATKGVTHQAEHAVSQAGGTVTSAARGVTHGAEKVASTTSDLVGGLVGEAKSLAGRGEPEPTAEPAEEPAKPRTGGKKSDG